MAISKDDTVLTYSKFKEFWTQFAVLFNKKLDGGGIKNNVTTTDEGYVLDARVGKTLNDKVVTLQEQTNGIYLATNSAGKWGYKTSKNGAVTPFRNPVGTATAGDVLTGKTFANASSDSLTGTMPNRGSMTATLTPTGNNTATKTFSAGYYTGGTITANGATAYNAGVTAADARTNTSSASYKEGYTSGYNAGHQAITFVTENNARETGSSVWTYANTNIVIPSGYTKLSITAVTLSTSNACRIMKGASIIHTISSTSDRTVIDVTAGASYSITLQAAAGYCSVTTVLS